MPIHHWTRIDVGTYHDFHQDWTMQARRALNAGVLPPGYIAQADQRVLGYEPDVTSLRQPHPADPGGGLAVAEAPPPARQTAGIGTDAAHARKANRIAVKHRQGDVVAVIEVVSPGNKDSKHAIRSFTRERAEFLRAGVNVLASTCSRPPGPGGRPPGHPGELSAAPFDPRPADKPLTVAGHDAGAGLTAHVGPLAVGERLPDGPPLLGQGRCVNGPLGATGQAAWDALPAVIREQVAPPVSG